MRPAILAGIVAVVLALGFYTAAVRAERNRWIDGRVLRLLVLGVLCDLASMAFMIRGARGTLLTPHGVLGFSTLGLMVVLVLLVVAHRRPGEAPPWLHLYFRIAYVLWLVAFASGVAVTAAHRT